MSKLLDALSSRGVPDTFQPDELELFGDDLLASVDPIELDNIEIVERAAIENAPEFIALAEATARADKDDARLLLNAAAAALPELTNLIFLEAADVALSSPHLLLNKGRDLAVALYDRIGNVRQTSGLQAYAYLETLTRLGLTQSTARFRALELLTSINLDDSEDLLERLPKLIGLAIDSWDEDDLKEKLHLLQEHDGSRADASYEIALQTLRRALEADTVNAILDGFTSAREQFTTVENMEEARDDATLFRCALDLTVTFVAGGTNTDATADSLESLTWAIERRAAWTMRSSLGSWAAPRRQAEAEWFALARTLERAVDSLAAPSWNAPVEALAQVLAAYRASRSVTVMTGEGLQLVLKPTVETAFLRREGLFNHLSGLVSSEDLTEEELGTARELLSMVSVSESGTGGDGLGKAWRAAPELAAELGSELDPALANELAATSQSHPNLLRILNDAAKLRARMHAREADPIVDQLLERVLAELKLCPGLTGIALVEFTELITYLLKFSADRANIGRMNGGPDVRYLFEPENGEVFTEDFLQRDIANWLKTSPLRRFVEMEQHDVAGGRADITVTQTHKFTIEVKRELRDVSPGALLKAYGGQAAAYSVTGPSVSVEMVLDLTDQSRGTLAMAESVWVQKVPIAGGKSRYVVTIIIHGNRLTPRKMTAN